MRNILAPWTRQPSDAVAIDWGHPLAAGLVSAVVPSIGDIDLVRGFVSTAGTARVVTQSGWSKSATLSGNAPIVWNASSAIPIAAGSSFTSVAVVDNPAFSGSFNQGLWRGGSTSSDTTILYVQGSATVPRPAIRINGTDVLKPASGPSFPAGRMVIAYANQNAALASVAWNGAVRHTAAHSTATAATSIYNAGTHTTTNGEAIGNVALWLHYNRALSAAELAQITDNPWQVFAPVLANVLATVGASSASLDQGVSADVGTLNVTGYAATLAQAQAAAADVGTLAVTGYAATLAQAQAVAGDVGALAVTGYAATLAQAQAVMAGAGTLSLAGFAPTLTSGLQAEPDVGALAITGYAATLAQAQADAPDAGSFAVTGYAPVVTSGMAALPGAGELPLTGYAPGLAQAQHAAALAGTFSFTGYAPSVAVGSAAAVALVQLASPITPERAFSSALVRSAALRSAITRAVSLSSPLGDVA